jgi:hypothetical protein
VKDAATLCAALCTSSTAAATVHAAANGTAPQLELDLDLVLESNPGVGEQLKRWCQQHGSLVSRLVTPLMRYEDEWAQFYESDVWDLPEQLHYLSSCTRLIDLRLTLMYKAKSELPAMGAVMPALRGLQRLTLLTKCDEWRECGAMLDPLTSLTHLRLCIKCGLSVLCIKSRTHDTFTPVLPSSLKSLEIIGALCALEPGEVQLQSWTLPGLTHLLVVSSAWPYHPSTHVLDLAKLPSTLRSLSIQRLSVSQTQHQLTALTSLRATLAGNYQQSLTIRGSVVCYLLPPQLPASLLHVEFDMPLIDSECTFSLREVFAALPPSLLSLSMTAVSTYSCSTSDAPLISANLTLAHLTALTQLKLDVDFGTMSTRLLTSLPQSLRGLELPYSDLPNLARRLARLTQLTDITAGCLCDSVHPSHRPCYVALLGTLRRLSIVSRKPDASRSPDFLSMLQHATQLTALELELEHHLVPELPVALAPLTCLVELDVTLLWEWSAKLIQRRERMRPPASVATQLGAILSSMPLRTLKLFAVDQRHEPPPEWLIDDSWRNKLLGSCSEHVRRLHPFEARPQPECWCGEDDRAEGLPRTCICTYF